MSKRLLVDSFLWGFLLWLAGYTLGILLFMFVPTPLIGWVITPIGIVLTLLVLFKKINNTSLKYYFVLSIMWTAIAIIGDYFFLVKLFNPADGYYKLDVYLYYFLTFSLPLFAGWKKLN